MLAISNRSKVCNINKRHRGPYLTIVMGDGKVWDVGAGVCLKCAQELSTILTASITVARLSFTKPRRPRVHRSQRC